MTENHALIEALMLKFARGKKFNKKERAIWEEWLSQSDQHRQLPLLFKNVQWLRENLREMENISTESIWENVQRQIKAERDPAIVVPMRPWWRRPGRVAAAAAVIVVAILGGVLISRQWMDHERGMTQPGETANVPGPGHFRVLLTVGNGNPRVLDSVAAGKEVVVEGNSVATKRDAHTLVYTPMPVKDAPPVYHSIATGKTEAFAVQLADGSKVYLSYDSRLRYPTAFGGKAREIFLEGEAYFDIAKDPSRPFIVRTGQSGIRVLGTRFNVMAYGNEPGNEVSLFIGAVEVFRDSASVRLKPGQQVAVSEEGLSVGKIPDPTRVLAWMDSCWRFDHTPLQTVLRQIARWHQMTVVNPEGVQGVSIKGKYGHEEPLDKIVSDLQQAESGNARIQIQKDTIYIKR